MPSSETDQVIRMVKLRKDMNIGLGVTITCGDTYETVLHGAYVESIRSGSPADLEGTLKPGDHILSVNGENVEGFHYLDVVDLIQSSGPEVEMIISKSSALHGATNNNNSNQSKVEIEEPICIKSNAWVTSTNNNADTAFVKNKHQLVNEDVHSLNWPPIPKPRKKWAEKPTIASKTDVLPVNINSNILKHTLLSEFENSNFYNVNNNRLNNNNPVIDNSRKNSMQCLEEFTDSNNEIRENLETMLSRDILTRNDLSNKDNKDAQKLKRKCLNENIIDSTKNIYSESMIEPLEILKDLEPGEVFHVVLEKQNGTFGLNLNHGNDPLTPEVRVVFIHSVISGGAAQKDGRVRPGDKLLEVNNIILEDLEYQEVITLLRESPSIAHLVLARGNKEDKKLIDTSSECGSFRTKVENIQVNSSAQSRDFKHDSLNQVPSSSELPTKISKLHQNPARKFSSDLHNDAVLQCANNEQLFNDKLEFSQLYSQSFSINDYDIDKKCYASNSKELRSDSKGSSLSDCSETFNNLKDFTNSANFTNNNITSDIYSQQDTLVSKKFRCETALEKESEPQIENCLSESCQENLDAPIVPQRKAKKFRKVEDVYKFSNLENTFNVIIRKSSRGLGLGIFGGYDLSQKDPVQQLIRIRKLYPLQPAVECGQLEIGDVILEVNGKNVVGLTNTEALEILRTASSDVFLKVYRPDKNAIPPLSSYIKDGSQTSFLMESPPSSTCSSFSKVDIALIEQNNPDIGEFEITLMKREGSLGFTVSKKEEESFGAPPPGIYIKALVREPAKSDGRIQPGDRILQVNGTDVSGMSHAEAISFLRSSPETVLLKLFRSNPPLSPASFEDESPIIKPLRKEAIQLLTDKNRNKNCSSSSEGRKRNRKRLRNKLNVSSSSGASETSTGSISSTSGQAVLNSSSLENHTSEDDMSSEGPGLQRNQRPKSLDVLNTSDRKQRLTDMCTDDDSIANLHRQVSVIVPSTETRKLSRAKDDEISGQVLLKWRGATLIDKEEKSSEEMDSSAHRANTPSIDVDIYSRSPEVKTMHIDIDRGWHGRLGFSLYDCDKDDSSLLSHAPVVKAVYSGSLADKDGRIKPGDRLIEVNNEIVADKPASHAIDLLRKTRGILKMKFERLEVSNIVET